LATPAALSGLSHGELADNRQDIAPVPACIGYFIPLLLAAGVFITP
jgi:hypothetical protein